MAPAVRGLDGYCRGCFDAFGAEVKLDATSRVARAPDERHPSDWDPDDALYEVIG